MVIAIDGPAGSGKSTTARIVAQRLGFLYLDTGAMYRAVALAFSTEGEEPSEEAAARLLPNTKIDLEYEEERLKVFLNGEDVSDAIRSDTVGAEASRVATLAPVRERLVQEQRRIAREYERIGGGVVVDGRDIGTVVFPDAGAKFFMTADANRRAGRRLEDLRTRGEDAEYSEVLAAIRRRDEQDEKRALAPLRKADDAVVIDTSELSINQQVDLVIQVVKERQNNSTV